MADIRGIKRHLPSKRKLIQLYSALLYNAHVKGFIEGDIYVGKAKLLCVPGLNCYSCPGAVGSCPLGALQNAIASSGYKAPYYMFGIILLYGIIFGRTICGYLCPFGLIQELLHKIPSPKVKKGIVTKCLSYLKYFILLIFVFIIPFWYSFESFPVPAFCKYICPAGTAEGAIGLLSNPQNADKISMLGLIFERKFIILSIIILSSVFVYRSFCRFLCPLGALYGLFSKVSAIGIKVNSSKCTDCGRCIHVCPVDIKTAGDSECVSCGKCISTCPVSAIELKAGKYTLKGKEEKKNTLFYKVAVSIALIVLALVLLISNTKTNSYKEMNYDNDFTVALYNSDDEFVLSEHLGKKVAINFWATWCGPCVKELPYFDQLYKTGIADVVAIHSALVTDDVENYLSGFDYSLPFALDEDGTAAGIFGVSSMLPHTVVLDEEGNVIYNSAGSLDYDQLLKILGE